LFGGAARGGKALSLDTPIPTPEGWTTMGDIEVGDTVIDEQGNPCQVIATSEIMHNKQVFDVHFSDGAVIRACGEHRYDPTWHSKMLRQLLRCLIYQLATFAQLQKYSKRCELPIRRDELIMPFQ
jgi:hypothetical protein